MNVNDEIAEEKIKNLNAEMEKINVTLEKLPDVILSRMNENIELKISICKKDLEMKFYKYIAGLSVGLLLEFALMIVKFFFERK